MCTLIPVKIDLRFMQMLISIKNKPGVMAASASDESDALVDRT